MRESWRGPENFIDGVVGKFRPCRQAWTKSLRLGVLRHRLLLEPVIGQNPPRHTPLTAALFEPVAVAARNQELPHDAVLAGAPLQRIEIGLDDGVRRIPEFD